MKITIFAPIILCLVMAACAKPVDNSKITLTGTVEMDTVRVSSLVGGTILELNAEEGKTANAGDVIAIIDCRDFELQVKQLKAGAAAAKSRLNLAKNGPQAEDKAVVKELLNQSEVMKVKAEKEYRRMEALFKEGSLPEKTLDDVKTAYDAALAQNAQVKAQYEKITGGTRKEDIDTARALADQSEAAIEALEKKIKDCVVKAPLKGKILHRLVEKGEIAAPGMPLTVMADTEKAKAKAYISETDLGRVKLGETAVVYADSFPDKPVKGMISYISEQAEFTPKNIQTKEERVKTVYEIQVTLDNKGGELKAGMPVDIVIIPGK